jgi:hypothetical protein
VRNYYRIARILTYLNNSHMMTIGANELAIFVVPKGCMAKSRTKIAHVDPMIVAEEMPG